jgi:5'-3' exonuclease
VDVVIVSADKDIMQLVGDGVALLNPTKVDGCSTRREWKR